MTIDEKVKQVEEMWKRVDALESPEELGFTTEEYAKRKGITYDQARHRLRRLAEAGKLIMGKKRNPGGDWINVFRLPEEEK